MLIEFTPEERKHIEEIQNKYAQEMEKASKADKGKQHPESLALKSGAIYDAMAAELDAFSDKCQKKRFKKIAEGGKEGIISHAKEQAPALLETLYNNTLREWGQTKPEDKELKLYSFVDGKMYLSQAYALEVLKLELQLHINALSNDKEARQEIFTIIRKTVKESSLTDNTEAPEALTSLSVIPKGAKLSTPVFRKYALMNNHVNNKIITNDFELDQEIDGQFRLYFKVDQSTKMQIQTLVCLSFTGEEEKRLSRRLTGYDKAVLNAISNIYYYTKLANPSAPYVDVTLVGIWRHMQGKQLNDTTGDPGKAQLERLRKSIDKMRHIDFTMDVEAEIKNNLLPVDSIDKQYIKGFWLKDYLLNCAEVGVITNNGKTAEGYRITNIILLTYNILRKNIISVDFDLLDTSEALNDSEGVIEIKQYLLQQIVLMKNKKRNSNRILLNTIYTAAGIEAPEERAKNNTFNSEESKRVYISKIQKADRDKIEKILKVWTGKNWIKDFTPVFKGRTITGYDIDL